MNSASLYTCNFWFKVSLFKAAKGVKYPLSQPLFIHLVTFLRIFTEFTVLRRNRWPKSLLKRVKWLSLLVDFGQVPCRGAVNHWHVGMYGTENPWRALHTCMHILTTLLSVEREGLSVPSLGGGGWYAKGIVALMQQQLYKSYMAFIKRACQYIGIHTCSLHFQMSSTLTVRASGSCPQAWAWSVNWLSG